MPSLENLTDFYKFDFLFYVCPTLLSFKDWKSREILFLLPLHHLGHHENSVDAYLWSKLYLLSQPRFSFSLVRCRLQVLAL